MFMYKKVCITNRNLVQGDFLHQIHKVIHEGIDLLILREKDLSEEEYLLLSQKVLALCEGSSVLCMLHTFIPVAMKLNHPYIHLPMPEFCKMTDEEKRFFRVIGVSTHTVEEAVLAEKMGATYVTASHIFPTACKEGMAPRGLDYLSSVVQAVHLDVYALGGIHPENQQSCLQRGAAGICMMSEYMKMESGRD